MKNKLPLLLLALVVVLSSCRKETIGFKSKKKGGVSVEEIDFDYFMARTKVRYAEGRQTGKRQRQHPDQERLS
jgi:hypothetical protein